jgi:hypothetical protein
MVNEDGKLMTNGAKYFVFRRLYTISPKPSHHGSVWLLLVIYDLN